MLMSKVPSEVSHRIDYDCDTMSHIVTLRLMPGLSGEEMTPESRRWGRWWWRGTPWTGWRGGPPPPPSPGSRTDSDTGWVSDRRDAVTIPGDTSYPVLSLHIQCGLAIASYAAIITTTSWPPEHSAEIIHSESAQKADFYSRYITSAAAAATLSPSLASRPCARPAAGWSRPLLSLSSTGSVLLSSCYLARIAVSAHRTTCVVVKSRDMSLI